MRFRPCIDLHQGAVKQIVGSTYSDDPSRIVTNFVATDDSTTFARQYQRDGLRGGHVIMLGSGNTEAAIASLKAYPGGLQVGGGITPDNAGAFLDAGASHVIMTSYVFSDGKVNREHLTKAARTVGKNRLVLDLSCKRKGSGYLIVTDRWQKLTDTAVSERTLTDLAGFCDEFLIHAADVEGKQNGIDLEIIQLLGKHSPITATYAGGIRSIEDLELVKSAGNGRVDATIGSALDIFGGSLKYTDVVTWDKLQR